MTRPLRAAAVAAAVLLLPACTSFAETDAPGPAAEGTAEPSDPAPDPVGAAACPAERAEPDPDRPRISLDMRLEDDLVTVTGTETVVFTPDLDIDELVFRLVPNAPDSAAAGNRLEVGEVTGTTSPVVGTRTPARATRAGCTWSNSTASWRRGSRPRSS